MDTSAAVDPTLRRAAHCDHKRAGQLTGVETLALFERKARAVRDDADSPPDAKRAAALAITYGQEARQRYTEALAHINGTHNPVDLEALADAGVSAEQERARFEVENQASD